MTPAEIAYQKFKQTDDEIKTINQKQYYRVIHSDFYEIEGIKKGVLTIVPSPDMPKFCNRVYQDENGNRFVFKGFIFIRFTGEVPEWYLECGACEMGWKDTNEIGKFLTLLDQPNQN